MITKLPNNDYISHIITLNNGDDIYLFEGIRHNFFIIWDHMKQSFYICDTEDDILYKRYRQVGLLYKSPNMLKCEYVKKNIYKNCDNQHFFHIPLRNNSQYIVLRIGHINTTYIPYNNEVLEYEPEPEYYEYMFVKENTIGVLLYHYKDGYNITNQRGNFF